MVFVYCTRQSSDGVQNFAHLSCGTRLFQKFIDERKIVQRRRAAFRFVAIGSGRPPGDWAKALSSFCGIGVCTPLANGLVAFYYLHRIGLISRCPTS